MQHIIAGLAGPRQLALTAVLISSAAAAAQATGGLGQSPFPYVGWLSLLVYLAGARRGGPDRTVLPAALLAAVMPMAAQLSPIPALAVISTGFAALGMDWMALSQEGAGESGWRRAGWFTLGSRLLAVAVVVVALEPLFHDLPWLGVGGSLLWLLLSLLCWLRPVETEQSAVFSAPESRIWERISEPRLWSSWRHQVSEAGWREGAGEPGRPRGVTVKQGGEERLAWLEKQRPQLVLRWLRPHTSVERFSMERMGAAHLLCQTVSSRMALGRALAGGPLERESFRERQSRERQAELDRLARLLNAPPEKTTSSSLKGRSRRRTR